MSVVGQYVKTFAEGSHALPDGMHMNAGYPFMIPKIAKLEGRRVTLTNGRDEITATIRKRNGQEVCTIEQVSTWERIYRNPPTKFVCYPFKDQDTPAIGGSQSKLFQGRKRMGTKNNPGKFDCWAAAEDDEPLFVLLGRDKHAPTLVWLWSVLRELDQESPEKVKEARECAVAMLEYTAKRGGKAVGLGHSALAAVLELCRAANAGCKAAANSPSTIDNVRAFFATTPFDELMERKA